MSGISGTCGASLASQLFQHGIEQQTAQRLEQQRELQQQRLHKAQESQPGDPAEQGLQDHDQNRSSLADPLKGSLLDAYA
ncbi:hypothetical protein Tel_00220 [Candidatus Tenderia electrophaga]|jgi:hypothetical protein|uniref:Uncharacterized protein n=1 Tax=Candidatus Tenderia electrophaga TaxID=1748243 RepID=A0A0S2T966_9GAMM|nr:hypothetical protein Tel_00220 [Candidatus Tenderia electrophaga]